MHHFHHVGIPVVIAVVVFFLIAIRSERKEK